MEDERSRLRAALGEIASTASLNEAAQRERAALDECYHSWLVDQGDRGMLRCPICGKRQKNPKY